MKARGFRYVKPDTLKNALRILHDEGSDAVALAGDHGLSPVFETARMYTGPIRPLRLERVFGVTTFELG